MNQTRQYDRIVYANGTDFYISDSYFQGLSQWGDNQGAAIYLNGHFNYTVSIIACSFISCISEQSPGAVAIHQAQNVTINSTTATRCFTYGYNDEESDFWGQYLKVVGANNTIIDTTSVDNCPDTIKNGKNQRPIYLCGTPVKFSYANISNCACSYCSGFYVGYTDFMDVSYITISNTSSYGVLIELEYVTGKLDYITINNYNGSAEDPTSDDPKKALGCVYMYHEGEISFDNFAFINNTLKQNGIIFGISHKYNSTDKAPQELKASLKNYYIEGEGSDKLGPFNANATNSKLDAPPVWPDRSPTPTRPPKTPTEKPIDNNPAIPTTSSPGDKAGSGKTEKDKSQTGLIVVIVIAVLVIIALIAVIAFLIMRKKDKGYKDDLGSDSDTAETDPPEIIKRPDAEKFVTRTVDYQNPDDSIVFATKSPDNDVEITV